MEEIKDQIKGGIDFEERIIAVLVEDILQLEELKELSEDAKSRIVSKLKKMQTDSLRHKETLEGIIKKY